MIHHGDCLTVMKTMDANSIDAVVTDPPYGLEFMGKSWDKIGTQSNWQSGGGFSKPGIGERATAWPSFSATSKFGAANPTCSTCGGRLRGKKKCACESPAWKPIGKRRDPANEGLPNDVTGSGMAKQLNAMEEWHYRWAVEALRIAKPGAYLLAFGGTRTYHRLTCAIEDAGWEIRDCLMYVFGSGFPKSLNLKGDWSGWGTALKPAYEPILIARKPLDGTVAENVMKWGTGAMNIDGSRIPFEDTPNAATNPMYRKQAGYKNGNAPDTNSSSYSIKKTADGERPAHALGRWPANLIHDGSDEVLACFPDAPGQIADAKIDPTGLKTQNIYGAMKRGHEASANSENEGEVGFKMKPGARRLDAGSAARFFYTAKASASDRGHEEWDALPLFEEPAGQFKNTHPTVKPLALMRYLLTLVSREGSVILDPFLGSGTTLVAAQQLGREGIGIEAEAAYVEIATRRLAQTGLPL